MNKSIEIIMRLTEPELPPADRSSELKRFADENDWLPSDQIEVYPGTEGYSNGHLVIEHGLDNSAVITFLKNNHPFSQLNDNEKINLLSMSYNNLVEWHFFPDINGMTCVFNRLKTIKEATRYISINEEENVWRAEAFNRIVGRRPNPNIKSLDDALIDTISFWKRAISSELGNNVKNEHISALFNGIIFARAVEDLGKRKNPNNRKMLLEKWDASNGKYKTLRSCINIFIKEVGGSKIPKAIIDNESLSIFDDLDRDTVFDIFSDFYISKDSNYKYDFFLMSKHALSRIYEHYVSLLRHEDSIQKTLFPGLPDELRDRTFGGIYTPQYIARFFARYLKENLTPKVFRELKSIDPACGSGIFLRTLLEMQCDPFQEVNMNGPTRNTFSNVMGVDIDENACQATRLSLNLLYLVLTGNFLENTIKIINAEAISHFGKPRNISDKYDVVITNPPFVAWDNIQPEQRDVVQNYMSGYARGKIDMYLAFLKLGMDLTNNGGLLLYVLPHSFLLAENAKKIRKEISSNFIIRSIVDLSEIDVFGKVGSYVILLIAQKQQPHFTSKSKATIVRCKEYAGQALQSVIEGKKVSTDLYEIYDTDQALFREEYWHLLPPEQMILKNIISKYPSLDEFLEIKEGFITGADDIFIRDVSDIFDDERIIYVPYLSDRNMDRYKVPTRTKKVVLYPYIKDKKLTENEIKREFPKTWKYLKKNEDKLKQRKSAKSNPWWCPVRPRSPENMLVPKIVSPHLVIFPKFSLDKQGKYGVSRCPLMYPKVAEGDIDMLHYFLAVLNSSVIFWQIANLSHKYSRGYFMLEPKTLKKLRVPNPSNIPSTSLKAINDLIKKRLKKEDISIEYEIDNIIADIYGLSEEQKSQIGIGDIS